MAVKLATNQRGMMAAMWMKANLQPAGRPEINSPPRGGELNGAPRSA